GTPGNYQVTASAAGARNVAQFQLTNRSPTAGTAVIGIGTGSNRSAIGPATTPDIAAVPSSMGTTPRPVTVPVALATSGARSAPRAEVRLSGRGWGLGAPANSRVRPSLIREEPTS